MGMRGTRAIDRRYTQARSAPELWEDQGQDLEAGGGERRGKGTLARFGVSSRLAVRLEIEPLAKGANESGQKWLGCQKKLVIRS